MSHWVEIKTEVRDLNALRQACRELGPTITLEIAKAGEKLIAAGYGSNRLECDARITIQGCNYHVGLVRQPSGAYAIQAEFYGCHGDMVSAALGQGCRKLLQLYGVARTELFARQKGYSFRRQVMGNGKINVVLNVP